MARSKLSVCLPSTLILSIVVVAALVLSACGDSSPSTESGTGPNPAPPNGLVPQAFAELPRPGSARPLDVPTVTPSAVTQSYDVTALSPGQLMGYYFSQLPFLGWKPASGTQNLGQVGAKSVWTRDHLRLEVITTAQQGDASAAPLATGPTQLDLVLRSTAAH